MLTLNKTTIKQLLFVFQLLKKTFPYEERRDFWEFITIFFLRKKFHSNLIYLNHQKIGLLHYWNLPSFMYIEHFAIHPKWRNKKFGEKTLLHVINQQKKDIILEVEIPKKKDTNTIRRISFYKRLGFVLLNNEYYQPSYHKSDHSVPLRLMVYKKSTSEINYLGIKKELYKEVYHQ